MDLFSKLEDLADVLDEVLANMPMPGAKPSEKRVVDNICTNSACI